MCQVLIPKHSRSQPYLHTAASTSCSSHRACSSSGGFGMNPGSMAPMNLRLLPGSSMTLRKGARLLHRRIYPALGQFLRPAEHPLIPGSRTGSRCHGPTDQTRLTLKRVLDTLHSNTELTTATQRLRTRCRACTGNATPSKLLPFTYCWRSKP